MRGSLPFSVEKASAGRPWMFQSRTSSGLARKKQKSKSSECGILSVFTLLSQYLVGGGGQGSAFGFGLGLGLG